MVVFRADAGRPALRFLQYRLLGMTLCCGVVFVGMLHNGGGQRGLYGNLSDLATQPLLALATPNVSMVATGITPEAIDQNPVVYELMAEMGWRNASPSVKDWVARYAVRRYGAFSPAAEAAWDLLRVGAYSEV
jgi:alpha-N-acetylglucosaminidase